MVLSVMFALTVAHIFPSLVLSGVKDVICEGWGKDEKKEVSSILTDEQKMVYNEKIKESCKLIAEKTLDKEGMKAVRYYDKAMYCREREDCQELTNQVFIFYIWKIGEMIGIDPAEDNFPTLFLPLCDAHIRERLAYSRVEEVTGKDGR